MSQPDSPSNLNFECPLGNFRPLLSAEPLGQRPLGQTMPQLQFMRPLGTKPLTTLDLSVFWADAQGPTTEISEPFEASPFFPELDAPTLTSSSSPTLDSPTTTVQNSSLIPQEQEQSATGANLSMSDPGLSDLTQHSAHKTSDLSKPESLIEHDSKPSSDNSTNPPTLQKSSLQQVANPQTSQHPQTIKNVSESRSDVLANNPVQANIEPSDLVQPKPKAPKPELPESSLASDSSITSPKVVQRSQPIDSIDTALPSNPVTANDVASSLPVIPVKSETDTDTDSNALTTIEWSGGSKSSPPLAVPPVNRAIEPESSPNELGPSIDKQGAAGWTYNEAIAPNPSGPALFQQDRAQQSQIQPEPQKPASGPPEQPQLQSPEEQVSAPSIDSKAPSKAFQASPADNPSVTSSELQSLGVVQRQVDKTEIVSEPEQLAEQEIVPEMPREQRLNTSGPELVNEPSISSTDIQDPVQPEPESSSIPLVPDTLGSSEAAIQRSPDSINRKASSSADVTPSTRSTSEPSPLVSEELKSATSFVSKTGESLKSGNSFVSNQNGKITSKSGPVASTSNLAPDLAVEQPTLDSSVEGQSSVVSEFQPLEVVQRQADETEVLPETEQPIERSIAEVRREERTDILGAELVNEPSTSSTDIQDPVQPEPESSSIPLVPDTLGSSEAAIQRSPDSINRKASSSADVTPSTRSTSEPSPLVSEELKSATSFVSKTGESLKSGNSFVSNQNGKITSKSGPVASTSNLAPDLAVEQPTLDSSVEGQSSVVSEFQPLEVVQRQADETEVLPETEQPIERSIAEVRREKRTDIPGAELVNEPSINSPDIQARRNVALSPELSPPSAQAIDNSEAVIQRAPNTVDDAVNTDNTVELFPNIPLSPLSVPDPSSSLDNEGLESETSLISKQGVEPNSSESVALTSQSIPDSMAGQLRLEQNAKEQPAVNSDLQPPDIVQRQVDEPQMLSQSEPITEWSSTAEVLKDAGEQRSPSTPSNSGQPQLEPLGIPSSSETSGSASVSAEGMVQRSLDSAEPSGDGSIDLSPVASSDFEISASVEALPSTLPAQIDQGAAVIQQKSDSSLSVSQAAESMADNPALRSIDNVSQPSIDNLRAETSEAMNTGVDADIQQVSRSENAIQRSPEQETADTNLMSATPTQWSSIADLLAQSTDSDSASSLQRSPAEPPPPAYLDLHPYEPPAPIQASPAPVPNSPFPPVIQRDVAPTSENTTALAEIEQPPEKAESSEEADTTDSEAALEDLAQTVYQMMQQRLMIERERLGRYYSSGFR